jgi:glycosyltransferase involved in cell wall biosynthesis
LRVLMVTDAWKPQVNGVVHTLERLAETLAARGVQTEFLTPQNFKATVPLPTYPDIRIALTTPARVARLIDERRADHIHLVTEGPLGWMARRYCHKRGRPFTTSYHTKFPEYLSARLPVPQSWAYGWLRAFHNSGTGTLVATRSLAADLASRGFTKLRPWTRGVDTELFRPERRRDIGLPRPIFLCAGRVAVEKNLPAFLDLDLPGTKVIVGEGPELARLKAKYPVAVFLGRLPTEELADHYASADVFVFPSVTDTFGNVIVEALASGTPVAAFPVTGPIDIVRNGIDGALSTDLREAALAALKMDRAAARKRSLEYSWAACAEMFLDVVDESLSSRGGRAATADAAIVSA